MPEKNFYTVHYSALSISTNHDENYSSQQLNAVFKKINEEWITEMFALESKDKKVLDYPEDEILNKGGHILFVGNIELGIFGAGALIKTAEDEYELSKMGVLKTARGLKAGDFLLSLLIVLAKKINSKKLYLLTNKKCEAAIHLYLKHGFEHSSDIMQSYSKEYARCDVAMELNPGSLKTNQN
jgi:N-acetylglutamate synthase-like GNAT family acetyltransferase